MNISLHNSTKYKEAVFIYCPNCGEKAKESDNYCSACDNDLSKSNETKEKKKPKRGTKNMINPNKKSGSLGCSTMFKVVSACLIFIIFIFIIVGESDTSENDIADSSENQIEKVVIEDDEIVENEEDEGFSPSEKNIDEYIDYLISSTAGHSTNTGYKRVIDFWTEGVDNDILVIRLQGDENFTTGMTRGGIMSNTEDIIKQLFEERNDISTLEIEWYMVLINQRGQENNTNIISIEFSENTYNSINWDRFLRENLPNVADNFWAHINYR